MVQERGKYDTNPLDPDYAKRVDEQMSTSPGAGQTGAQPAEDAPTLHLDNRGYSSYPSVFVPPPYAPPVGYDHAQMASPQPAAQPSIPPQPVVPVKRKVSVLGIPENAAAALPYVPFYIGIVASLIELFLIPRKERVVRFHAAQGLTLQLAILVIDFLFRVVGFVTESRLGGRLFSLAAFIFLIVSAVRVWKGERHHIGAADEATQWLDQRIDPRN